MKKTQRFLFGVISSLLLAAGFAHAADDLDPITTTLGAEPNSAIASLATDPCSAPCDINDPT